MAGSEDFRWQFAARNPLRRYEREVLLKSIQGKKVLDIGGGVGRLADELRRKGHSITVLDHDKDLIRKGKKEYEGIKFVHGSVYSLPFKDRSFDEVVMEQVLEHLDDHKKAVSESLRVLRKGGTLTITTPNKPLYRIYIFFCRLAELKFGSLFSHVEGHISEIGLEGAKKLGAAKIQGLNPFLRKAARKYPGLGIDLLIRIEKGRCAE